MARTTKNKYYRKGGDKYSVEHKCAQMDMVAAPGQSYVQIVPDTGVEGMRKVKHITISAAANVVNVGALYWALVYVPQGYAPNNLNLTGGASMYEPNQNVMACGVFDFEGGPLRIRCPLSRNLNSGDKVYLVAAGTVSATYTLFCTISYAITLQ